MSNRNEPHIELGRKTEAGTHATESPEKLFGRLIAMELITISLCEAILNNKDLSHVRREFLDRWQNAEETVNLQTDNYKKTRIGAIANSRKQSTTKAFRDSVNEFLNYLDDIE